MEKKFKEEILRLYKSRKQSAIPMISTFPSSDEFFSFVKKLRETKDPTVNFYLQFDDFYRNHPWGREAAFHTFLHFKNI